MKTKYHELLRNIIENGELQTNKKGTIKYLINQSLTLNKAELSHLFTTYKVAETLLEEELKLYLKGDVIVNNYRKNGIKWWDYCSPLIKNSYPTYFKKAPELIKKINKEKRPSKNYVLFLGETGVETNQLPCLSLIQFQICNRKLHITVYQRSADSNLGLPSDLYQIYLISKMIKVELVDITFFIGNAHIYENNIAGTKELLLTGHKPKFNLNV